MKKLTRKETASILARGIPAYIAGYPTVVSLEMTYSCCNDCKHCNMGGIIEDEKQIGPDGYRKLMKQLKPIIVQVSGGEPLLRTDLVDILKAIKPAGNATPYLIVVSNGWLLTKDKYLAMREAGINQLSISLCFPDERHDTWRGTKGLFAKLDKLIPELAALGHDDIVLNCAITRENMPFIMDIARVAERWGVGISYSAYSVLRTGNRDYTISSEEDLAQLRGQFDQLRSFKEINCGRILNADFNLQGTLEFFEKGEMKGCSAGNRFLVVTPQGTLKPCSMHDKEYTSIKQIKRDFVPHNDCGGCYVSIRSYLDKPLPKLVMEYFGQYALGTKQSGATGAV